MNRKLHTKKSAFRWEVINICNYLDHLPLFCSSLQLRKTDSSLHWCKRSTSNTFLPLWLLITWTIWSLSITSLNIKPPIILQKIQTFVWLLEMLHLFLSHQNGFVLLVKQPSHRFPVQPLLTVRCISSLPLTTSLHPTSASTDTPTHYVPLMSDPFGLKRYTSWDASSTFSLSSTHNHNPQ